MPRQPYRSQIDWPANTPKHITLPVGYCTCGCDQPLEEAEATEREKAAAQEAPKEPKGGDG